MNIELHIERIVLEGIEASPRYSEQLRESVRAELARLLRDGGLAGPVVQGETVARVNAPSVDLPTADPGYFGQRLASAIYRGIRR